MEKEAWRTGMGGGGGGGLAEVFAVCHLGEGRGRGELETWERAAGCSMYSFLPPSGQGRRGSL